LGIAALCEVARTGELDGRPGPAFPVSCAPAIEIIGIVTAPDLSSTASTLPGLLAARAPAISSTTRVISLKSSPRRTLQAACPLITANFATCGAADCANSSAARSQILNTSLSDFPSNISLLFRNNPPLMTPSQPAVHAEITFMSRTSQARHRHFVGIAWVLRRQLILHMKCPRLADLP